MIQKNNKKTMLDHLSKIVLSLAAQLLWENRWEGAEKGGGRGHTSITGLSHAKITNKSGFFGAIKRLANHNNA